jgi:hypothetical protein
MASNSIEGFNVTVEDAIAAVEGDEPLDAANADWLAVHVRMGPELVSPWCDITAAA